ncbi:magnesium-translocating P-type ATPase [Ideonella azotifigens]|uniref:magnesium-translocating P-type ATPase n=1 Tax=Ideonella azotifigens TaxID=513160 RepID=UPI001E59874D|nr:magnesium-translocating P-type ATPase [Ideonella azotifigens]MCD2344254.1 magnesium-translocating P-type ATPase [Ideonella azotifigens]
MPTAELLTSLLAERQGLSSAEASRRLAAQGANTLDQQPRRRMASAFLAHFNSPLVLMLLLACGASAVMGDATSAAVIAFIVVGSVALEFVQEHRAGDAAERLKRSVALNANVLRDGTVTRVPAAALVPGDVVQLAAGDMVPADGRVIEARDFFVRQAMLTGEAYPVEKKPQELDAGEGDIGAAVNAAFMGASVLTGSATLLVCRTGRSTFLGEMSHALGKHAAPTAFERGTRGFGQLLVKMTAALVLFVTFAQLLAHQLSAETFLFAVALAVGLTPELLPMVVSVTLARGALRMAERKVVVKHLPAIQNMGSMDVLCTDKTGTLTEASIRLERAVDAEGRPSARVLELAWLNSHFESGLRSPLDDAILAQPGVDPAGWQKLDEVPFGFERRRVSVLVERAGERLLIVKGAPEDLVALCTQAQAEPVAGVPQRRPLDDQGRASVLASFNALSRDGLRVLAVASRRVPPAHDHAQLDDERELVFCGFAVFLDPPKAGVSEALSRLRALHVHVKVLTGDNEGVTRHVCAQVGLPVHNLLTGAQIEQLDDAALAAQAQKTSVFCRVSPAQKSRVLNALKSRGHVVGYIGDGVNDAPALHDADVGISVDTAVDVAKDAADMILLERDLNVLHDGVVEGRRTFSNVMKYIMMATSSNFGNMLSMAAASVFLPFLPMLPVQVLLNNLLYDASEATIPFDGVDAEELLRPHDWDPAFIRRFTLVFGPLSSLFDFATFAMLRLGFGADAALFRTGWFIESMATQVLVIFVLRTRGRPWRSRAHPALATAALATVAVAVLLPFTPLAGLLGFVAPPAGMLLAIAGVAALYLVCVEFAKRGFHRLQRPA